MCSPVSPFYFSLWGLWSLHFPTMPLFFYWEGVLLLSWGCPEKEGRPVTVAGPFTTPGAPGNDMGAFSIHQTQRHVSLYTPFFREKAIPFIQGRALSTFSLEVLIFLRAVL